MPYCDPFTVNRYATLAIYCKTKMGSVFLYEFQRFLTVLVALDDRLEKLFFSAESVTQDRILGKALLTISVYKKGSYPIKRVRDYITLSGGQEMKVSYQEGKKLRRPKQI